MSDLEEENARLREALETIAQTDPIEAMFDSGALIQIANKALRPVHEVIWTCSIGGLVTKELPQGADAPMRKAVQAAYHGIFGFEADFNFSGWGGKLTTTQRSIAYNS
jgi:hypothetical protein